MEIKPILNYEEIRWVNYHPNDRWEHMKDVDNQF